MYTLKFGVYAPPDDQLWTTLQQQTAIALQGLKFDQHLQDDESKATALDFIKFLTNSNRFANYVGMYLYYIVEHNLTCL